MPYTSSMHVKGCLSKGMDNSKERLKNHLQILSIFSINKSNHLKLIFLFFFSMACLPTNMPNKNYIDQKIIQFETNCNMSANLNNFVGPPSKHEHTS